MNQQEYLEMKAKVEHYEEVIHNVELTKTDLKALSHGTLTNTLPIVISENIIMDITLNDEEVKSVTKLLNTLLESRLINLNRELNKI
jgi:hypothetical protein